MGAKDEKKTNQVTPNLINSSLRDSSLHKNFEMNTLTSDIAFTHIRIVFINAKFSEK
jgi:hypothetical protein